MSTQKEQSTMNRRGFLQFLGLSVGVAGAGYVMPHLAFAQGEKSGRKGIMFDATRCIGCHYCEGACKKANALTGDVVINISALSDIIFPKEVMPYELVEKTKTTGVVVNDDRNAERWLRVVQKNVSDEASSFRHSCLHCGLCAQVCPAKALVQKENGTVEVVAERCIGCHYCYQVCPFDVPRYRSEKEDKAVQKCTMCATRVEDGGIPACVEICPAGALVYGDIEDVVATAKSAANVAQKNGLANAQVYGVEELDGKCNVVYVLPDGSKKCGFPKL